VNLFTKPYIFLYMELRLFTN